MEARLRTIQSKFPTMVELVQLTALYKPQIQHLLHAYWIIQSTIQTDKLLQ